MQIINNKDAIIKEQINLGDIGNLNIDDLFKDDTNNKKMKNKNYPSWLVPLEIAKELKTIGFNEPCHFYFLYYHGWEMLKKRGDEYGFITSNRVYLVEKHNENGNLSLPTWEQAFEWFREKGYIGTINDKNNFYYKLRINGKCNFIDEEKFTNYEDAREKLINKLIETYKTNEIL